MKRLDATSPGLPVLADYASFERSAGGAASRPWLTVVTTVFNSLERLPATLQSVRDQQCDGVEIVVADGGSHDGTSAWLGAHPELCDAWISQPDAGIYDGMNRGVAMARGRFIAILNAGDTYELGALNTVKGHIEEHPGHAIYHGGLLTIRQWGGAVPMPPAPGEAARAWEMPAHHPAAFVRREVYAEIGLFRTDLKIVSDLFWMHRALQGGVDFCACKEVLTRMPSDGVSNRGGEPVVEEIRRVLSELGAAGEDVAEWEELTRISRRRARILKVLNPVIPVGLRRMLATRRAASLAQTKAGK
jgi:hypothetical protein